VIDFDLSDEQAALREVLKDFAERELRPIGRRCEDTQTMPGELRAKLRVLGVTDGIPAEFGGGGELAPLEYLMAAEELAYGDPGLTYDAFSGGHAALLLTTCGSARQRARYLPRLADGALGSVLYYEGWGRGADEIEATAAAIPAGWNVNAEKFFVSNPATADVSIVVATDIEAGELRAFALEGTPRGYIVGCDDRVTPNSGLRAAHTGAIALRGLTLDAASVLPGRGLDLARALAWIRLTVPAIAIGAARAASVYAIRYAQERIAFGKPISAFQGVAFLLADGDTAIDAARLSLWSAAQGLDHIEDVDQLNRVTTDTVSRVCAAMEQVARDATQVLGGAGFIRDHPVEYWWRCAATLAGIDTDFLAIPATV
jgi:alkylation response protein AidB-like acyl-CoA dehydrogenase